MVRIHILNLWPSAIYILEGMVCMFRKNILEEVLTILPINTLLTLRFYDFIIPLCSLKYTQVDLLQIKCILG